MGGEASGCSPTTTSIFLEAACFEPVSIATSGRRHKLLSDSRYRFERGVDPALQRQALERATALVQEICGGKAGPIVEVGTAHRCMSPKSRCATRRSTACSAARFRLSRIVPLLQELGAWPSTPSGGRQLAGQGAAASLRPAHRSRSDRGNRPPARLREHRAARLRRRTGAAFSPKETTRQLDRVKDALDRPWLSGSRYLQLRRPEDPGPARSGNPGGRCSTTRSPKPWR